jgi:hypothetical protein
VLGQPQVLGYPTCRGNPGCCLCSGSLRDPAAPAGLSHPSPPGRPHRRRPHRPPVSPPAVGHEQPPATARQTTWHLLARSVANAAIREPQDPQRRWILSLRGCEPPGPASAGTGSLTSPWKRVSSGDSLDKSTCLQLLIDMFHVKHRDRGADSLKPSAAGANAGGLG